MRVLILGGSGFIGSHITQRLVKRGHDVAVFARSPTPIADAELILGDRNHLQASSAAFRAFRPEVVVDAIAYTEQQAHGLMAAFQSIAQRLVLLSSGDVYRAYDIFYRRTDRPPDPAPLAEDSPLRDQLFPYRGVPLAIEGFNSDDYEKILVERVAISHPELPATILRLPMVYGPGDSTGQKRRFWAYLKRMEDRRPAIVLDERTARWNAPWGYAEDVAEAVRLVVENPSAAGEIYNVCDQEPLDVRSWIQELAAVAGWSGDIVVVDRECPAPSLPRKLNLDQRLDMDSHKIRRHLKFQEMFSRRQALSRTATWDLDHPLATDPAQFDYEAEDAILSQFGHSQP